MSLGFYSHSYSSHEMVLPLGGLLDEVQDANWLQGGDIDKVLSDCWSIRNKAALDINMS